MHFDASHDFSDWLFKLFSSVARKIALGSFIDIVQSKLHRQHHSSPMLNFFFKVTVDVQRVVGLCLVTHCQIRLRFCFSLVSLSLLE